MARIDKISSSSHPYAEEFNAKVKEIIGFHLSAIPSRNGNKLGFFTDSDLSITIDLMGEGTPNILGLVAYLAGYDNKLILIEELENDLHPAALTKLLDLIAEKSENCQFVITTHSNIVVRHLGSLPGTKLFKVTMERENRVPRSTITEVGDTAEERTLSLRNWGISGPTTASGRHGSSGRRRLPSVLRIST